MIKSDWEASQVGPPSLGVGVRETPAPPMLFGQEFNLTDAPNRYSLPPFLPARVDLDDNPAGTFAMWNPRVHCDET